MNERQQGRGRWTAAAMRIAALALIVLGIVAVSPDSSARVYPYYIVRNASADLDVRPRILFVLDTSGSMSLRAQSTAGNCDWDECEAVANEGTNMESRIASARNAIQNVVLATAEEATYALMTFDQLEAWDPTTLPTLCTGDRRFEWVTSFSYSGSTDIYRYADQGAWRLCQGNEVRPYPYLRWDDLGQGSTIAANNMPIGGEGPSPLLAEANVPDWQNAYRDVQWFDRFVGIHFQPNATTDPDHSITYATTGDYGTNNLDKDANVYNQDFYYFPYVDGFPGYGQHALTPDFTGVDVGGIAYATGLYEAQLYAPFYIDNLPPLVPEGPADAAEAEAEVLSKTSKMIEGGVDASGVTPWASIVGIEPGTPPQSNDYGSHTSIASYLSFVTNVTPDAICVPTAAVLISDGEPYPATEGGSTLYERLAALRNDIGVETYVVGFFLAGSPEINNMACSAAGACAGGSGCSSPCTDTPTNSWDTCADPDNPTTACAWEATSSSELQTVLTEIINVAADLDVPSGPGATVNQFAGDPGSGDGVLQTRFTSRTEYPAWQGHLARQACDDLDESSVLEDYCVVTPVPAEDIEETFGDSDLPPDCPPSYVWDAGECLQDMTWNQRRLYTHDPTNTVFRISEPDGTATPEFEALLDSMTLLDPVDPEAHADAVAAYLLGRDAPSDWKLPGLANSSPVVVRRMPEYRSEFTPPVAINDPHCGGRFIGGAATLPDSLTSYAQSVNDASARLTTPSTHYEQQEAVVIADDMGIVHAFQLNSGNELFGFIPRFALESAVAQADIGAATYGQQGEIENHNYGVSSTLNHGWVFDDSAADPDDWTWRHLGVIGMGVGGYEWLMLDLSHMSPASPNGPIEVLWTSEDPLLKDDYDRFNGETWARPAIAYHVDADIASNEPDAFLVMGSGYPETEGTPPAEQGRTLMRADVLTGEITDFAELPAIAHDVYDTEFGALVDTAVATHCLSRFWAEAQETYIADPAGRVFRWDLGRTSAHEADSGALWGNAAQAISTTPFYACTGATTCTASSSDPGDPFIFPAAVSANDRIDDFLSGSAGALTETDQFLVALISGSAADDSLDDTANFHSSLYVLVDDHSGPTKEGGFSIPSGTAMALPGADPNFMRMPVSQIERRRDFRPFPGSPVLTRTANFSPDTRPIRAPRIFVTGVVDEDSVGDGLSPILLDGVEVYYIEFTVYEPPSAECDSDWFDAGTGQWYQDPGQTYTLTFRLTNTAATPFDMSAGAGAADSTNVDFGGTFGDSGLVLDSVTQVGGTDCQGDDCGAAPVPQGSTPCDNNSETSSTSTTAFSLRAYQSELQGFTPVE